MTSSARDARPRPHRRRSRRTVRLSTVPVLLQALVGVFVAPPTLAAQEAPTLRPGETVSGTLARGDTARYTVSAEAEMFVQGVVEQVSVDVVVRILNPEGDQRARFDGPALGPERFRFETGEAGEYRVEVLPFDDAPDDRAGGDYTVTLLHLERIATDPSDRVEQLVAGYTDSDEPGVAIQVWRGGETLYSSAFGSANLAYEVPFETDTPTNIGSTSKQFTAFAVLLLAERGELSLDDPVTEHIPELKSFSDTVRVRNLINHTTGYREVYNLLLMTGRRIGEGDYVDRDEILAVVARQPALQNAPGAEWNYNNTAFALASMVVERVSGMSYPEFMAQEVFGPLGMAGTRVRPHAEAVVEGRSMGYAPDREGGYREIRDLGAAVGAGGMYSTVEDLQRWVENYEDPQVGSQAMVDAMTTPTILTEGDTTDYGFGLFVDEQRGLRRVHHGGADIAHRSMLVWYPEIDAGVTTQSNHAGFDSNVAFRIAEAFFDEAMEPEEEETTTAEDWSEEGFEAETFDDYVGRYALDAAPQFIITLSREGGTFYAQATGQPQLTLTPTSDSTFDLNGVEASVALERDEEGTVDGLVLHQNGEQHATRLPDDAAEWSPDADDLAEFTGRYLSDELATFYEVVLDDPDGEASDEDGEEEARLRVRHRRLDDFSLTPGTRDEFSGGSFQLSFERDRNGEVIGFYLANGRTRDVRFERRP